MATKRLGGRFSVFAMPLVPGQADTVRRMREEVLGPRRREYEESRRHLGITEERAWIQSTPMGEMVLVYMEGRRSPTSTALQGMVASQEPFHV